MDQSTHSQIEEQQKDLCKRHGSNFVTPNPEAKIGIAIETIGKQPIRGVRLPPENGTDGWYVYCGNYSDDPDFYKPVHVHHVADVLPQILPFLGLEVGFNFIADNDGYEDVWRDQ